jgi:replicative DNA helicase
MRSPLYGISQRTPPANLQAEQALLGAILSNNNAFDRVSDFLRPEHFADPVNGRVYEAAAALINAGRVADAITLKGVFEGSGVLEDVGGVAYLGQLLAAMVGIINAGEYGKAVFDCWHRRKLIAIGVEMVDEAFGADPEKSPQEIQEKAESALFMLADGLTPGEKALPAHESMSQAIDAAVKNSSRPGGLVGVTTGYRELDDITGGWRGGHFVLLAARPSMGKTTLALGMAVGAASASARVLFVTREMPQIAIGAKLTAGLAPVPGTAAERGRLRDRTATGQFVWNPIDDQHIALMVAAQRAMTTRHLIIDECRAGTIAAIRSRARREKRRGGLDLVVVDYLGLLRVPELERSDNETLRYTRLSMETKALAVDLDVPVLMLAQLNRGPEGREDKRPGMADLRQSGSLEQDADVVMFLYREHYYLTRMPVKRRPGESEESVSNRSSVWAAAEAAARGRAEVIIAKQRMGATGTKQLAFSDENVWFTDLAVDGGDR